MEKQKKANLREKSREMTIYKLKTPVSEEEIRKLRVNDILYISGLSLQLVIRLISARWNASKKENLCP